MKMKAFSTNTLQERKDKVMAELVIKADGLYSNRWCLKCNLRFKSETEYKTDEICPNCGSKSITVITGYECGGFGGGSKWVE